MLFCVASLAPTDAGVAVAAQASYSITTLPSNGSPPTSSTRLPAGFSRGGDAGLGLTTPSVWTSIGGAGGCVCVGLYRTLRWFSGGAKGACRRRCRSENLFWQAD